MFKQLVASVCVLVGTLSIASAQSTLYWDINGSSPGAGQVDGFTDGTWGTDSFWSTDPNGEVATGAWVDGSNAVFSAGSDAVDHFVPVDGTQNVNSLTIEDGVVFIPSGTVNQGTGDITIEQGATFRISSRLRINDGGRVILRNGTLWQSNPGFAGSFIGSSTTLEIDGEGTIDRTALMDDGSEPTEPLERQINIYTTSGTSTIAGTGGTPENGGAGTLIKTGPSEFRYQGTGLPLTSYAKLVVEEGLFRLGFNANTQDMRGFGADPLVETPDAITLNGGSIATSFFPANLATMHPNRGITIGPNGGTFGSGHMIVPSPISGSGTMKIEAVNATVRLSNGNNSNTFTGGVEVNSGVLALDESLVATGLNGTYNGDQATPIQRVDIAEGKSLTIGSGGGSDDFSGDIRGPGDFVKLGAGTQTLSGAEAASSANMVVEAGTLSLTAPILTDTANVSLLTGAMLNLDFSATNIINSLFIDEVAQAAGIWGAVGSGAANESSLITGSGLLEVTDPGVDILIGDYNQDGQVDIADYTVWRNNLGADGSVLVNRDPANMGVVSASDYQSWKSHFGESAAAALAATSASVPEPGTMFVALAGLVLLSCRQVLRKTE